MPDPPDPALRRLGAAVRQRRRELGLSQEALAERCGLHTNYVGGIERGERNVGFVNLAKVAGGLGLTLSDLARRYDMQGIPR